MYRLGNDNFSSQLRARWLDNYQYRLYQYVDYLNNPTSLTDGQNEKARGLGSGAVLGQALDGSCNLIP
jgi:hypothetical protein